MVSKANFYEGAKKVAKSRWSIGSFILLLIGIAVVTFYAFKVSNYINTVQIALTPPNLPKYTELDSESINPDGWGKHNDEWFHFVSQGTATLPIPYEWFIALEEPVAPSDWPIFGDAPSLFLKIMGRKSPLFTEEYIYRAGFIKAGESAYNPDNLPIGFTKTPSIYFKGIDRRSNALGLTCAACHVGQFTHGETRYIVDGGPAVSDLGQFGKSLAAALGQTVLSSKLTIANGRFERFARRGIG